MMHDTAQIPLTAAAPQGRDSARIEALAAIGILGTAPEPHFDAVCRIARRIFGVAGAFVALMGEEQVWLKTPCELIPTTAPRRQTFCHITVERGTTVVARDTWEHPDFRDLAAVRGERGIRFYAGIPLMLEAGLPVGTFCLVDTAPGTSRTRRRPALPTSPRR
ncbi:GAF domain-containing protein [Methylobacterium persicinum]